MAVNLRNTGKILEKVLYGDSLSVFKYETKTKRDGSTLSDLEAFPSIESVPCKISFKTLDSPSTQAIENRVITVTNVFTSLDYEIKSGDRLEVTRIDPSTGKETIYTGNAGEPNRTENHQVIELINRKLA